ncbi:flagellar M-ring protein FliF, partial [Rhizobiaceae sp. 2RAB30]
ALGRGDAAEQEAALPFPAPNALPNFSENFQFPTLPTIGSFNQSEDEDSIAELRQKMRRGPQERLAQMVDLNEERTAMILRKWANPEAA